MAPPDPADPLGELRERLRATQEAAARLAGDEARVPPQGWAAPPRGDGAPGLDTDLAALAAAVAALRELVPPELQQQVADLIRQVLLLVRAILDRWIERLEAERGAEPEGEDIPIARAASAESLEPADDVAPRRAVDVEVHEVVLARAQDELDLVVGGPRGLGVQRADRRGHAIVLPAVDEQHGDAQR